jgi:hypothetical protein
MLLSPNLLGEARRGGHAFEEASFGSDSPLTQPLPHYVGERSMMTGEE